MRSDAALGTVIELPPLFSDSRVEVFSFLREWGASDSDLELCVSFDGACRNNQSKISERAASCGAVLYLANCRSVKTILPVARKLDCLTNNQAEISGATEALRLAIECFKATGKTTYRIVGDSTYVIDSIKQGHIANLTPSRSDQKNWDQWNLLRVLHMSTPPQMKVSWGWICRALNAGADRACNNVLDEVPFDAEFIRSVPPIPVIATDDDVESIMRRYWFGGQRPSCRYLANFVIQPWRVTVFSALRAALAHPDRVEPWAAFFSLPKILLFPQPKSSQRTFVSQNSALEKLMETFRISVGAPVETPQHSTIQPRSIASTIQHLVEQNRVSKALDVLDGDQTSIQQPTKVACEKYWPNRNNDLHEFDNVPLANVNFGSVMAAVKKLSTGKTPDIVGWNKELFMPVLMGADETEQRLIEELFYLMANELLPPIINELLGTDKGFFLGTEQKSRPIVVSSFFSKILWKLSFSKQEVASHFPPVDVPVISAVIQAAIQKHLRVIKLDGTNAFQSLRRALVFEVIQGIEDPLFRKRWNSCYGRRTNIAVFRPDGSPYQVAQSTTGVRAGCVSASKLFQAALSRCCIPGMLQVVDDIHYVVPQDESWDHAMDRILSALQPTGVDFAGPKTKFIGPDRDWAPTKTLGTIMAVSADATDKPYHQALDHYFRPLRQLVDKLVKLPELALQTKLFLLRAIETRVQYQFQSSLHPGLSQWGETLDVSCFIAAIVKLFDLGSADRVSVSTRCLISLNVGNGGLGVAQVQPLELWHQQRLLYRIHTFLQREENHIWRPVIEPPEFSTTAVSRTKSEHLAFVNGEVAKSLTDVGKPLFAAVKLQYAPQRHLLLELPRQPYLLSDRATKALVWSRLGILPTSVHVPCALAPTEAVFDHFITCSSCSQRTIRHNAVVYALQSVIRSLGITTAIPNHLPLPKVHRETNINESWQRASVTGPDLILYRDPTTCIDLSITAITGADTVIQSTAVSHVGYNFREPFRRRENLKEVTYKKWHEVYRQTDPEITCHPLVITTTGVMSPNAIKLLKSLVANRKEHSPWFVASAQLRMQKALATVQAAIYAQATHTKTAADFVTPGASQRYPTAEHLSRLQSQQTASQTVLGTQSQSKGSVSHDAAI